MKDDSDLDEADSDALTPRTSHAASSGNETHGLGDYHAEAINNSELTAESRTVCSNLALASEQHDQHNIMQTSIASSETSEIIGVNSLSSGTDASSSSSRLENCTISSDTFQRRGNNSPSMQDTTADMDEHAGMHEVDEERESSNNELSVPEHSASSAAGNNRDSGAENLEQEGNNQMDEEASEKPNLPLNSLPDPDDGDCMDTLPSTKQNALIPQEHMQNMNGEMKESASEYENCGSDNASEDLRREGEHSGPLHEVTAKESLKTNTFESNATPPSSVASQSSSMQRARRIPPIARIPLKSAPTDRTSMLTRGMSIFARSSKQMRYARNNDNDANSVISEISQDVRSVISRIDKKNDDDALRQHLEKSGLVLLRRLIEFLSECPPAPDEGTENSSLNGRSLSKQKKKQRGLTLPASAIGWLSTQIDDSCIDALEGLGDCYQIPKQQLQCLQTLFKRVTSLRISGEAWPPSNASTAGKGTGGDVPKKSLMTNSSRIFSKFSGDQSIGVDSLDDESCTATLDENNEAEIIVSAFQRYYHELQNKPDVNMSFFPNATKVIVDGIPPNWVTNLDALQNLDMFQMEKGCILDINQLFFPSDTTNGNPTAGANQKSPIGYRRDLSLIDEGKEKEGPSPSQSPLRENTTIVVYSSLSKLRLSNCAMGETAGLRGRRRASKLSPPRLPTFSRFPNLVSLNLSHNELFKTKSVFAGLSSLPLLSSINLSYNRLSSMDDVFMHIGNVTELILTGNDISSTRGLDRLFSLEHLSLNQNNIHNLASIAGIAKLPFLMKFDLKGNPLESDDPEGRIKVFNLFREVRCNNLPTNATFRDLQQLLPILDNELSTKDELVALKDLTFRQTVIPELPSDNNGGNTDDKNIDASSEISVNMPDSKGGLRRIVKGSHINIAHLRMAGSATIEKEAAGRMERFHDQVDRRLNKQNRRKNLSVQFNMKELITSIRPEIDKGDVFVVGERDANVCSDEVRARSLSSHQSEGKYGNTVDNSPATLFPFSLPSALLAEADDDVWNPSTQLDDIFPSDNIVWEVMPSDDDLGPDAADELSQKNESIEGDDVVSHPPVDEPNELDSRIDNVGSASSLGDGALLRSLSKMQEPEEEGNPVGSDSDEADVETVDLKSRKSMFGGIWEQSYRDNVVRNNTALPEPIDPTERKALELLLDFNAMEENSKYDGPKDYGPLFFSSDLDLYFDSYIFQPDSSENDLQEVTPQGGSAPRIQLFKFDRDMLIKSKMQHGTILPSTIDFHERYIGVWKEDVLACGSYAQKRLPPIKMPKRGFHGDTVTRAGKDVTISESRKFILCLSDSALYFIIDDGITPQKSGSKRTFPSRVPPNSTFSDACWPHAVARHPLNCLRGITIGFQFQRLILRFSVGNEAATSSALEYTYVILTSNKLQTVSFLQKIQSHVTVDNQPGKSALIDNDDKTFLDALSNEVVIHYQIVRQIWKRGDREASRRAFVLTDSKAYLLDETFTGDGSKADDEIDKRKKLGDVSLVIIDSARLSRVTEVRAANADPRNITLVILPQNKLKRSHRWRLVCNDGEGAERLIDDVRKAMGTIA